MSLVQFDVEISFDEGDVETLAVECDENVILRDPPLEIIQVVTIDVMEYGAPVVESDRRYRLDEAEPGRFNVQIRQRASEGRKQPPLLIRGQVVREEFRVVSLELLEGA